VTLDSLVTQYWQEVRLARGTREERLRAENECEASNAVYDQVWQGDLAVVDLLVALADGAPTDDDAGLVGAGPLEELISFHTARLASADGNDLLQALDSAVRQHPRFRRALESVFMGDEVPEVLRSRLGRFLD
jgi:hypothetical protein